jgi:hypothetical protein
MPGFSGEVVAIARFLSLIHSPANRFTSERVIEGSSCFTVANRYSMLVAGSPCRNAFVYAPA